MFVVRQPRAIVPASALPMPARKVFPWLPVQEAERLPAIPGPTRLPWPEDYPGVVIHRGGTSRLRLRTHPNYPDAKTGGVAAAMRVVGDLLNPRAMERLTALIGNRKPLLVPVISRYSLGANQIPFAYAVTLGLSLGLAVCGSITQTNAVSHTGACAARRLVTRALFNGAVKSGQDYLLVDDHVTMGGTVADLRAFIEAGGGRVVGVTTLTASPASTRLAVRPQWLDKLRCRFPELEGWWVYTYGYGLAGLTNAEVLYLCRFRSVERIKCRLAGASGDRAFLALSQPSLP